MKLLKYILPAVALLVSIGGAVALKASQVKVQTVTPEKSLPRVTTVTVKPQAWRYEVRTTGTVAPRTETTLTSEVPGRIAAVHPAFVNGGFFKAGDELVVIDDLAAKAALAQAEAALATAKAALQREEAEARLAKREWEKYGQGPADPLLLREPQLAERNAAVQGALAAHAKANVDFLSTRILAPYDGRVRLKLVEQGQFIGLGTPVARVYATDYAEVRLPLSADDIGFLELPLGGQLEYDDERAPQVQLSARFGPDVISWPARIVRTEAEVDPQTRMYYAVARVRDPYGSAQATPLLPNTFVNAVITGREAERVFVLPRAALRPDGRVLVVDPANRLKQREVTVVRATPESVLISAGLEEGEQVVTSRLDMVVEDMPVELTKEQP
ncbi:MAG: Multidrug resistance protein MdtA [Planctomycetes bacterium]|nr:Multidrug resistance protein MdtA [Planctomycetota bacterium]